MEKKERRSEERKEGRNGRTEGGTTGKKFLNMFPNCNGWHQPKVVALGEPVETIKGGKVFVQSATWATEQSPAFDQVFWSMPNL